MSEPATVSEGKKWRQLSTIERRVLGVLVEKAKTTPDNYPLSLNSLVSGCNQKSNRDPQMSLEPHQVENALETLRRDNAVAEIQGDGRVPKYRHFAYDWLGVEKDELAVITELLLRGAQTVGELRGRAARMGDIPDVAALKPIVDALIQKDLVIALSPEGRGQVVTHNLYPAEQLDKVKQQFASSSAQSDASHSAPTARPAAAVSATTNSNGTNVDALRSEVETLKSEVASLRREIEDIWANLRT